MEKGNISTKKSQWIIKKTKIPQVLINLVWEYDSRYKKSFNDCVQELVRYFNHSRLLNRIHGEMITYDVYLIIRSERNKRYPTPLNRNGKKILSFSKYMLSRISQYNGDKVPIKNLRPHNLRRLP